MTEGFNCARITCSHPIEKSNIENEQALQLLDQPFHFYKKGGQCFAFISEDGKTILKFFKQHHIRFWHYLSRLHFPFSFDYYRLQLLHKHRHQSGPYLFQSASLAYDNLKEQTGMIYLQIDKSELPAKQVILYDKLKIAHPIDISQFQFALQKKAVPVTRKFRALIKNQDLDLCKHYIDSMIDLMQERCKRGIADRDFNVSTNFGLLESDVIEIDIGSYHADEALKDPNIAQKDLQLQTAEFQAWLKKRNKELHCYFLEKLKNYQVKKPPLDKKDAI